MTWLSDFFHNLAVNSSVPVLTAFLLGLVSALGPCTMTTNIAAIAYIGRRIDDRKFAVLASLLYALGRMVTYTLLGVLVIGIGLEVPAISNFLQDIGTYVMGPLLIVVGILMLVSERLSFGKSGRIAALGARVSGWGIWGAFLMGILFGFAFCPYSALLFFAVMIPLALSVREGLVLPLSFALGTSLLVIVIGGMLSAGLAIAARWITGLTAAQKYIRVIMALVFIGVGIYLILDAFII